MRKPVRRHAFLLAIVLAAATAVDAFAVQPAVTEEPSTVGKAPSPPEGAKPDELAVARGKNLYAQLGCHACHGFLGTGGPNNAADLGQSGIAVRNDAGKSLAAFLLHGRPSRGMPPATRPVTAAEAADLSARFRWVGFSEASLAGNYGGAPLPIALGGQKLSIVVGDANYGRRFFNGPVGRCSTCHSVEQGRSSAAENLAHIATKYTDPKDLQDSMLLMKRPSPPAIDKTMKAVVSFKDGRKAEGYLVSVSDFKVVIRDESGKTTVVAREGGEPRVVLIDRLQPHIALLQKYQDNDIHDLTAYLVTLK